MKKPHWLSLILGMLSFCFLIVVSLVYPPVVKAFVQDVFQYFEDNKRTSSSIFPIENPEVYDDVNLRFNELKPKNINWLLYFLCSGGL